MKIKAIALLSGGLDSMLAAKLILNQGIDVFGITFKSCFFGAKAGIKSSESLKIPLEIIDITPEILELVKNPKYKHGKNMNPCIDCHILMIKKAGEYMEKIGADFIITGEVLGERPKSQNIFGLITVEKESGYKGKLLRPLSAKLLEKTEIENKGLVDREKLLAISGRQRFPQIKLAKEFEIENYPSPAGGCKLTEPEFSLRLKELFANEKNFTVKDIELLKIGRHFRTKDNIKIIIGRNEKENNQLLDCLEKDNVFLQAKDYKGPIAFVKKETPESIKIAAELTARYSDANKNGNMITICIGQENNEIKVYPMELEEIEKIRIAI